MRLSEETGLIHLDDQIPLLENAYYALKLMQSRVVDNVLKGKALLKKILAFEREGNYPVFLHEYPETRDPYMPLRLAPVYFWAMQDFPGNDFASFMEKVCQLKPASEWAKRRIKVLKGEEVDFPSYCQEEDLITMQMAGKSPVEMAKLWDPHLGIYTGPLKKRFQQEGEPLVDFATELMAAWSGIYPRRIKESFRSCLIRKNASAFPQTAPAGVIESQQGDWPIALFWGGESQCHSLILAKKHLEVKGRVLNFPTEIGEEEVQIYLNIHPENSIWVEGEKATVFQLNEKVEIKTAQGSIFLSFLAESGEGKFVGHISRGNRPNQLANKQELKFAAFDHKISLRTLKRSAQCSVRLELESQLQLPSHASHYLHTV